MAQPMRRHAAQQQAALRIALLNFAGHRQQHGFDLVIESASAKVAGLFAVDERDLLKGSRLF
jgi:hypothetical protein